MASADNSFAAALRRFQDGSGQASVGLWMNLTDPAAQEIAISSGFDWVLHDGEHAPVTLDSCLRALQIARGYGTEVIVRPPHGDETSLKKLLDIGARNLLVPMVGTGAHARSLASWADFPPRGTRGVSGQTRGGSWGRRPDYLATARDDICLIVQIESPEGVRNAAEIAAVDGVDAIFVGTADLAASIGHPGAPGHPEVAAAVGIVAAAARHAGKPLGTLARDLDLARGYVDEGFAFVGIGNDSAVLAKSLAGLRQSAGFGLVTAQG